MLLLQNGNIFNAESGSFKTGEILIEGAQITAVGDRNTFDSGASQRIDLQGATVLPGLIDAHSHIGTWVLGHNGNDANECVTPATPGLRIIDALNPQEPAFADARASGITTVMITPGSGNVIGGQCAIIKTYARSKAELIMKFPAALKMAFGENPKRVYAGQKKSPSSRMATAALVREMLYRATLYWEQKQQKPSTGTDLDLEAFIPVLQGEIPLKIHAHRADDIMTAVGIAEEFGLKLTLEHCTEGHLIVDYLKTRQIPVMLGPSGLFKGKIETANATLKNAGILAQAGMMVSLISDHPFENCKYLTLYAGYLRKNGLGDAETLRALTINPARALGIADRVGSIAPGKDADLAIFDGDPLETMTKVRMTLVNGVMVYQADRQ
jgi:imidazolonepropionase-like amidohydrolase